MSEEDNLCFEILSKTIYEYNRVGGIERGEEIPEGEAIRRGKEYFQDIKGELRKKLELLGFKNIKTKEDCVVGFNEPNEKLVIETTNYPSISYYTRPSSLEDEKPLEHAIDINAEIEKYMKEIESMSPFKEIGLKIKNFKTKEELKEKFGFLKELPKKRDNLSVYNMSIRYKNKSNNKTEEKKLDSYAPGIINTFIDNYFPEIDCIEIKLKYIS